MWFRFSLFWWHNFNNFQSRLVYFIIPASRRQSSLLKILPYMILFVRSAVKLRLWCEVVISLIFAGCGMLNQSVQNTCFLLNSRLPQSQPGITATDAICGNRQIIIDFDAKINYFSIIYDRPFFFENFQKI